MPSQRSAAHSMANGKNRDSGDVESQTRATEETPLLSNGQQQQPSSPPKRPSYRARRLSDSRIVSGESKRKRWWSGVVAGILGLSCILIATGLIISRERDGRHRRGGDNDGSSDDRKDTPDYSKLPPPKPGLRNPAYLLSGYNGAVASEVDVCSQIGIDGELLALRFGGIADHDISARRRRHCD